MKNLIIALGLVIGFSSCSKEEIDQSPFIGIIKTEACNGDGGFFYCEVTDDISLSGYEMTIKRGSNEWTNRGFFNGTSERIESDCYADSHELKISLRVWDSNNNSTTRDF